LQVGFFKPRGDVATVILDLVCLGFSCFDEISDRRNDGEIRSLSGAMAGVRLLMQTKIN